MDRMASVLNTGQLRLQQLVAFNDAEEEIYFTAGDPSQPGSSHLYSLNLPPLRPTLLQSNSTHLSSPVPVCISCHQNDPSCQSSRFTAAPKVTVGWLKDARYQGQGTRCKVLGERYQVQGTMCNPPG